MAKKKNFLYWTPLLILIVLAAVFSHSNKSHPSSHADIPSVAASGAYNFLDSLSVNIHTSYPQYTNGAQTLAALKNIGFWHVRDRLSPGSSQAIANQQLLSNNGITFELVNGPPPPSGPDNVAAEIAYAKSSTFNGGASITAMEGSNEVDGYAGNDSNWAADARNYQIEYFNAIKADPVLGPAGHNIPVLGPSLIGNNVASTAPQLGNLAAYMDYGNVHSYPNMTMNPPADYPEYYSSSNYQSFTSRISILGQDVFPGKSFWTSETGYYTPWNTDPSTTAATETVSSYYLPRTFLEFYRLGSRRINVYELLDEADKVNNPPQGQWGLVRSDNVTLKPDGLAIKNLFTILHDTTSSSGSLAYCACGAPADVHQLLLHRSDGVFFLALWRAIHIPTSGTAFATAGGSENVTVSFDQAHQLNVFHPSTSVAAQALTTGSSVVLPVSGSVSLLEISPAPPSPPNGGSGGGGTGSGSGGGHNTGTSGTSTRGKSGNSQGTAGGSNLAASGQSDTSSTTSLPSKVIKQFAQATHLSNSKATLVLVPVLVIVLAAAGFLIIRFTNLHTLLYRKLHRQAVTPENNRQALPKPTLRDTTTPGAVIQPVEPPQDTISSNGNNRNSPS